MTIMSNPSAKQSTNISFKDLPYEVLCNNILPYQPDRDAYWTLTAFFQQRYKTTQERGQKDANKDQYWWKRFRERFTKNTEIQKRGFAGKIAKVYFFNVHKFYGESDIFHDNIPHKKFSLDESILKKKATSVSILREAMEYGYEIAVLNILKNYKKVQRDNCFNSRKIFHWACENGHIKVVRHLLDPDILNKSNSWGNYPLEVACMNGHVEVAKLLLDNGANIDEDKSKYATPLRVACKAGQLEVTKLLLDRGANIDTQIEPGDTALHIACRYGYAKVAKLLLDNGANIDAQDLFADTALHIACQYGYAEVAMLLLDRGANIDAQNRRGKTALHKACQYGHAEVAMLLLDRSANIDIQENRSLTALHYACLSNHHEIVGLLLSKGSNVNAKTITGMTPWLFVCYGETSTSQNKPQTKIKTLKLLLENGADPTVTLELGIIFFDFHAAGIYKKVQPEKKLIEFMNIAIKKYKQRKSLSTSRIASDKSKKRTLKQRDSMSLPVESDTPNKKQKTSHNSQD